MNEKEANQLSHYEDNVKVGDYYLGTTFDKLSDEIWQRDGFQSLEEMFQYFDEEYNLSTPKKFYVYRFKWRCKMAEEEAEKAEEKPEKEVTAKTEEKDESVKAEEAEKKEEETEKEESPAA